VKGIAASQAAASSVQSALSAFYDQSFLDPGTWTRGVPATAWNVFSPGLRSRAEQDSASLALGAQIPTLVRLSVTEASLSIRVLVNPRGGAEIAAADVRFIARGDLKDGRSVSLTNRASFLFQSVGGRWLIVGYPAASTDVATEPSPTPTASGTSPSPTASGATP
jgi:hypothetical protein